MGDEAVQIDRSTGLPVSSVDLLRRRIVNVVGHELRTPATTVRGLAEAAATATDTDEREALLTALVRVSRRLEGLVEEVLLASAVTTALPVGAVSDVDLVACAHEAWEAVGAPAGLTVDGAARALAQPGAVRRALERVLANAATHGTAPFTATASTSGAHAGIEISSGGPTLRPEELSLATEAFFRGEAAVTNAPGLGLGLAVARTLLEGNGGSITIFPRQGGGVIASITLPAAGQERAT